MADAVIRRESEDDIEAVVDALEAVGAEGRWIGTEVPFDRVERADAIRNDLRRPDTFAAFVADVDGALVGFIGLHLAPYGVVSLGMAILDGYRSQGIGTRLVEHGIAWAREVGAHKLALEAWPDNERAIGLYKKMGFVEEGLLRLHYRRRTGEVRDALIMGLLLDEQRLAGADASLPR